MLYFDITFLFICEFQIYVIYDKYLSIFHDYVYNKLNILQHLAKSRLTAKQFERSYKTTTHFFSFFI